MTTLMNNFALVKCDEVLAESIMGSVDFFEVIDDDVNYPKDSSAKSLTKLNPQKPNLSETVLGKEFNRNDLREAHDALYDSRLLMRVVEKYCRETSDVDLMVDSFMIDSNSIRNQVKFHLSLSNIYGVYAGGGIFVSQFKG